MIYRMEQKGTKKGNFHTALEHCLPNLHKVVLCFYRYRFLSGWCLEHDEIVEFLFYFTQSQVAPHSR